MNAVQMRSPSMVLLPRGHALLEGLEGAAPIVRVGQAGRTSDAGAMAPITEVGAGPVSSVVAGALFIAVAAAWGGFSYSLFTGKWLFKTTHPAWGIVTGLIALSSLYGAANRISSDPSTT